MSGRKWGVLSEELRKRVYDSIVERLGSKTRRGLASEFHDDKRDANVCGQAIGRVVKGKQITPETMYWLTPLLDPELVEECRKHFVFTDATSFKEHVSRWLDGLGDDRAAKKEFLKHKRELTRRATREYYQQRAHELFGL